MEVHFSRYGEHTLIRGRLKRIQDYVKDEQAFCFTYGESLSDLDISALSRFHNKLGRLVTVTAVSLPGRYGILKRRSIQVTGFAEKPRSDSGLRNGGF